MTTVDVEAVAVHTSAASDQRDSRSGLWISMIVIRPIYPYSQKVLEVSYLYSF